MLIYKISFKYFTFFHFIYFFCSFFLLFQLFFMTRLGYCDAMNVLNGSYSCFFFLFIWLYGICPFPSPGITTSPNSLPHSDYFFFYPFLHPSFSGSLKRSCVRLRNWMGAAPEWIQTKTRSMSTAQEPLNPPQAPFRVQYQMIIKG